ncbi:hypothetical protein CAPTEDRAFT_201789 [Capitella teleta]|uniref:Fibrinogen C-terminal domain-containing protein n=1 Tax=Capitella teleta TaxID=283909 RepID=R7U534_CAPTE|nr:hypothetical protein CAPTEDRAFT_201789 [Capitella teleta]|eukprot:ELU01079.1 hypothetical protein CAPTEDRAFT_201789 [Capitella teleta]
MWPTIEIGIKDQISAHSIGSNDQSALAMFAQLSSAEKLMLEEQTDKSTSTETPCINVASVLQMQRRSWPLRPVLWRRLLVRQWNPPLTTKLTYNCTSKQEEERTVLIFIWSVIPERLVYDYKVMQSDDPRIIQYALRSACGVYTIDIQGGADMRVYCDMTTDGSGWLVSHYVHEVFQGCQDGSQDFYLNWNEYAAGFGDLNREFWLGCCNRSNWMF